ncbi:MAG: hypothetical protein JSR24_14915 [Proteobacteria bacterium]|nr:hypothetical protein [Pseudomonadota bacterium]
MTRGHALILASIFVAVVQAESRPATSRAVEQVVPVHWLSANFQGLSCPNVDINVGCVPAETTAAPLGR